MAYRTAIKFRMNPPSKETVDVLKAKLNRGIETHNAMKQLGNNIANAIGFDQVDGQLVVVKSKLWEKVF